MNNQTHQKDPHDRGQFDNSSISPGLRSIWLGMRDSNVGLAREIDPSLLSRFNKFGV